MKLHLHTTLITIAGCWLSVSVQNSSAATLDISGTSRYYQSGYSYYYPGGAWQSGRASNLGGGTYREGNIRVSRIDNLTSGGRSGTLSLEFWAMPYYGAQSGYIKMTRRMNPLYGGYYYYSIYRSGWMRMANQWRWPEFNLYEYTTSGWRWRDDVLFSSRGYL